MPCTRSSTCRPGSLRTTVSCRVCVIRLTTRAPERPPAGEFRKTLEDRAACRDVDVEYVGDHARPAVQEIDPAVLDRQLLPGCGGPRLPQEDEIAAIVQLPGEAAFGKDARIGDGGAGRILAEAGGVDHERARLQPRHDAVVVLGRRREHVFHRHAEAEGLVDAAKRIEPRLAAVRHDDPRRAVVAALRPRQVPADGDGRAARAHGEKLSAGPREVTGREESLEREAGADRVLGRGDELSVGLGEAAQFAHQLGERIHLVKEIAAGREKIDLVRRHQCAARQRIGLDEGDHAPIGLGRRVQRQVDADDPARARASAPPPSAERCAGSTTVPS